WINISRATAPPLRTKSFDSRMPRLPAVKKSPQTRLRAMFCPGVGNSVVTFDQSQSSSSATRREAGHGALAHFRAGDADDDRVVPADHHPGIHLGRAVRRADHVRSAERKIEGERKPATGGDRAHHKAPAIDFRHEIHGCLLTHWPRHGWPPAPADRCRSGRYW